MTLGKHWAIGLAGMGMALAAQADTLYTQGFDNLGTSGWVSTNMSAPVGQAWFQGNAGIFDAQAGATGSYAAANFLSAVGSGSIDNWLISPSLTLGSAMTLSFWARSASDSGFADAFKVYFSAGSDGSVGSFTSVLASITATTNGWTQYSFALPDAASGRIAFEYLVANADNANYMGIDSVSITSAVPEPTTYALMGLGLAGIALLRRRRQGD
ncbi:MAG TPA: choice-of-anchor J domain-containing protein [Burkholderiaceae bacterium]